jgi:hypothetical protein
MTVDKVKTEDKAGVSEGVILSDGIGNSYEMKLIKCNRGGYIIMRGVDVGAYPTIDEAIEFLRRDIKIFMQEPQTNGAPNIRAMPVHYKPIAGYAVVDDRRWTSGDIFGMGFLLALAGVAGFMMVKHYWPYFG